MQGITPSGRSCHIGWKNYARYPSWLFTTTLDENFQGIPPWVCSWHIVWHEFDKGWPPGYIYTTLDGIKFARGYTLGTDTEFRSQNLQWVTLSSTSATLDVTNYARGYLFELYLTHGKFIWWPNMPHVMYHNIWSDYLYWNFSETYFYLLLISIFDFA